MIESSEETKLKASCLLASVADKILIELNSIECHLKVSISD